MFIITGAGVQIRLDICTYIMSLDQDHALQQGNLLLSLSQYEASCIPDLSFPLTESDLNVDP